MHILLQATDVRLRSPVNSTPNIRRLIFITYGWDSKVGTAEKMAADIVGIVVKYEATFVQAGRTLAEII